MPNLHPRGRNQRRTIARALRCSIETLEPRVLMAGHSYNLAVYDFRGGGDGSTPFSGLVADSLGNLYGATATGAINNYGAIYQLPTAGSIGVIHDFTNGDGASPYGNLAFDGDGNLYGTTLYGGAFGQGAVFEILAGFNDPIVLHSFTGGADGGNPYAGLTIDGNGNLFGTTVEGGTSDKGTVFEITAGGSFSVLHSFTGASDGANPYGQLILNASGNLFGTTFNGGAGDEGTLFKIVGTNFSTLHAFSGEPDDGAQPTGRLIIDGGGNIFGTTFAGGESDLGTFFTIPSTGGTLSTLHSFTGGIDGANPYAGLMFDPDGNLFGTTFNGGAFDRGTVFEIPFDGFIPQTLYSFTGGSDGAHPYGDIFVSTQRNLFGTATSGGINGRGTLFELLPTNTDHITIAQQPGTITAGGTVSPSVIVNLRLANNNINTADNSTVTLSIVDGPSGGILTGTTTVTAHNGVANFNNLHLTKAGTYTLAVSDGSLDSVELTDIVINPGPATRLVFGNQPISIIAGDTIPSLALNLNDTFGNLTTDNSFVTLKIASGPSGAAITGTLTVQAVNGVATFDDLSLTKAGNYTLSVSAPNRSGVKSVSFTVNPDLASAHLEITRQPIDTVVAKKISPAVTVSIQDQFGNLVTSNTTQLTASLVVITLGGNATAATLTGTTTVNLNKGVATLSNLAVSAPGTYKLQLASAGFTSVTTDPFDSIFIPNHLVFGQQPTNATAGETIAPVTILIQDSSNRIDTTNNSNVTLTLKGNGTLNGTVTVAAVHGVATFSNLSINQAGSFTVSAASTGLSGKGSSKFTISPDLATAHLAPLTLPVTPSVVGKNLSPNLVVKIADQFGNVITSDNSAATLTIASGPTGGTITGTTLINASNGILTFKNISFALAGNYALQVTDGTLADPTPLVIAQTISQGVTTVTGLPNTSTHTFGQTFSLTANLKSNAPSNVPFTGTATLVDNSSTVIGTVTLTASGQAKFQIGLLSPGTYITRLTYPGDANHTPATSNAFTLQINQASTSIALAASTNSLVFGQTLTLTATVNTPTAPGVTRTGTITFFDGLTNLGAVSLNGSSQASLTIPTPTLGKHNFKAVYSGDANFKFSNSSTLGRTVNKAKTSITEIASLTSPVAVNQSFNLNIHVAIIAPGDSTLTGNQLTIKDNGKVLTVLSLDSNGDATLSALTYTASGNHTLTAIYAGDATTLAATSANLKLTIT